MGREERTDERLRDFFEQSDPDVPALLRDVRTRARECRDDRLEEFWLDGEIGARSS